jgi:hypothetical protein
MTARQKIESLTNAWYGFSLIAAGIALAQSGIGLFSIVWSALSLAVTFFVVWFIGRRLLAKSSLTRVVMLVISGVGTVLGCLATAKLGWAFLHDWSIWLLVSAFMSATAVGMYIRSWRTLTDVSVKAYFG